MGKESTGLRFPLWKVDNNWGGICLDDFEEEINQLEARDTERYKQWLEQRVHLAVNRDAFFIELRYFYAGLRDLVRGRAYDREMAESIWHIATEFVNHSIFSACEFYGQGRVDVIVFIDRKLKAGEAVIKKGARADWLKGIQVRKGINPERLDLYRQFLAYHRSNYLKGKTQKAGNARSFCRLNKIPRHGTFLKSFNEYYRNHKSEFNSE